MTKPLSRRSGSRQLLAHLPYVPYRTSAEESVALCPISNGTTAEQDLAGTAALDSRQATGRGWVPRKVHDPHSAMTITSRKWDRLTNGMRQRVGTAGKTASSRGERRSGHRPIEGCGGSANNRHDRQGTERNSLYLHSANGREWAIGSGAVGFLIWAFRWIAAASMDCSRTQASTAHPRQILKSSK